WPRPVRTAPKTNGLWEFLSRQVVKRPLTVWGVAVLVLLPFAGLGLLVRPTFKPTGDLSPNAPSIQGLAVLQKRFPAGETGALTVLLTSKTDWDTPAGRDAIELLCNGFPHLGNVAEVRSLTQPLGRPLATPATNPALDRLLRTAAKKLGGLLGT